jgi:hypothetical protein
MAGREEGLLHIVYAYSREPFSIYGINTKVSIIKGLQIIQHSNTDRCYNIQAVQLLFSEHKGRQA